MAGPCRERGEVMLLWPWELTVHPIRIPRPVVSKIPPSYEPSISLGPAHDPLHLRLQRRLAPRGAPHGTHARAGAVSIVSGGTLVTFDVLPAVADWSTASTAGLPGDITTAAALDTAVAALTAGGITSQLLNPGGAPAANTLASFDSVALNVLTRPTGVKFTELMATLQNNTGGTVSTLALSYNFGIKAAVAESPGLWGHRV